MGALGRLESGKGNEGFVLFCLLAVLFGTTSAMVYTLALEVGSSFLLLLTLPDTALFIIVKHRKQPNVYQQ